MNFFSRAVEQKTETLSKAQNNPYLQSKILWNDLYGDVQTKLENAYRVIALLLGVIIIAIIGLVHVAEQSKIEPYVSVIHDNELLSVQDAQSVEFEHFKPQLSQLLTTQFLQALRSVSSDMEANRQHRITAFSFVRGAAQKRVSQIFEDTNPDVLSQHRVTSVHVTTLLLKSNQTLSVRWEEISHDAVSGELLETTHYSADVTYRFDQPSQHELIARSNPMGFYIEQFVWDKDK